MNKRWVIVVFSWLPASIWANEASNSPPVRYSELFPRTPLLQGIDEDEVLSDDELPDEIVRELRKQRGQQLKLDKQQHSEYFSSTTTVEHRESQLLPVESALANPAALNEQIQRRNELRRQERLRESGEESDALKPVTVVVGVLILAKASSVAISKTYPPQQKPKKPRKKQPLVNSRARN